MARYSDLDYWNSRYTKDPAPLDFYLTYPLLRPFIHKLIKPNNKILNVGCGSSMMAELMAEDGFIDIVNIDNSRVVINQMNDRTEDLRKKCNNLIYDVADCINLQDKDESFNVIIDKALLDTLLTSSSSQTTVPSYLMSVARMLKPAGTFILISSGNESERMMLLENGDYSWTVEVVKLETESKQKAGEIEVESGVGYYLYICRNGGGESEY